MKILHPDRLLALSCLTGFFGDLGLQLLTSLGFGGTSGWGLHVYFQQHGRAEALFVAAGMMTLFYVLYWFTALPWTYLYLAIYGVILDLLFRYGRIFPSLDGYYNALSIVESALWGAIPMMLPLFFYSIHI
jgi:hypothetical protein